MAEEHTPGFTSRGPDCTDGDVQLCPLHKAAHILLAALKKIDMAHRKGRLGKNEIMFARLAIAEAEKKS